MNTGGQAVGRYVGRLAALSVLFTALPAYRLTAQCPDGSPPPCRAQATRATAAPNTVAVLYFDNLSPDTADAYLADGLTEELTSRLGEIERIQVKSRNAVRRFKSAPPEDLAAVGRALRVRYFVEGSVRRAGTRLRVAVRLVKADDGFRVWGEDYERPTADLLALQSEIAREVVTKIAGRLLPAERATLAARPTSSPQAYEHLLSGNYYLAQRTPRAVARAIREYEAAAAADPTFAAALAGSALGYETFLEWGWPLAGLPPESLLARGFAATDAALRSAPHSAEAWMARALLLTKLHPRSFEGARTAFQRAAALDPLNAELYHQYGVILGYLGQDSAARATLRQAISLEPERAITLVQLGILATLDRRLDEARRWLDSALAIDPTFYYAYAIRAGILFLLSDTAGVRADGVSALQLGAGYDLPGQAALMVADAMAGDTLGARAREARLLATVVDPLRPTPREGLFVGAALVALGERDRALDLLERVQPRGAGLWFALRAPHFDPIRSHPRFQWLVEESRPR